MIRPLFDRVLVRAKEVKEPKSPGGIFLAGIETQERNQEGTVMAVGDGLPGIDGNKIPLDVKEGDKVIFPKRIATKVRVDDEELIMVHADDILAILVDNEQSN